MASAKVNRIHPPHRSRVRLSHEIARELVFNDCPPPNLNQAYCGPRLPDARSEDYSLFSGPILAQTRFPERVGALPQPRHKAATMARPDTSPLPPGGGSRR